MPASALAARALQPPPGRGASIAPGSSRPATTPSSGMCRARLPRSSAPAAGRVAARRAPARRRVRGVRSRPPRRCAAMRDLGGIGDRIGCSRPTCSTSSRRAGAGGGRAEEVYNLASPSFVPRSWDELWQTAEFAAVGVTALLEAIRRSTLAPLLPGIVERDLRGACETPQSESTPLSPVTPTASRRPTATSSRTATGGGTASSRCSGSSTTTSRPAARGLPAAQGLACGRQVVARAPGRARARGPHGLGATGATPATTSARCG